MIQYQIFIIHPKADTEIRCTVPETEKNEILINQQKMVCLRSSDKMYIHMYMHVCMPWFRSRRDPACKVEGLECSRMDNNHWKVPPYWTRKYTQSSSDDYVKLAVSQLLGRQIPIW